MTERGTNLMRRGTRAGGPTFHVGSNTGNIAANSRDFTLNATTNNGVDLAAVVTLARALRQAAPALALPSSEEAELTDLANRIEEEAGSDHPDPSRLQRWGSSVVATLNSPVVSGAEAYSPLTRASSCLGFRRTTESNEHRLISHPQECPLQEEQRCSIKQ
ncbi:hypothetical protein ABZ615_23990 [Streptomyces sp. NPDC007325]|uniref:hypothetical protein n=1 Tax=Streptomyces sp. NPDC007325 TaxID=3154588 RepID=UPI0033C44CFF